MRTVRDIQIFVIDIQWGGIEKAEKKEDSILAKKSSNVDAYLILRCCFMCGEGVNYLTLNDHNAWRCVWNAIYFTTRLLFALI